MKDNGKESMHGSDTEDARVEVLQELLAGLHRFPDKLRLMRGLIEKHLAPGLDPSARSPVRPARKPV